MRKALGKRSRNPKHFCFGLGDGFLQRRLEHRRPRIAPGKLCHEELLLRGHLPGFEKREELLCRRIAVDGGAVNHENARGIRPPAGGDGGGEISRRHEFGELRGALEDFRHHAAVQKGIEHRAGFCRDGARLGKRCRRALGEHRAELREFRGIDVSQRRFKEVRGKAADFGRERRREAETDRNARHDFRRHRARILDRHRDLRDECDRIKEDDRHEPGEHLEGLPAKDRRNRDAEEPEGRHREEKDRVAGGFRHSYDGLEERRHLGAVPVGVEVDVHSSFLPLVPARHAGCRLNGASAVDRAFDVRSLSAVALRSRHGFIKPRFMPAKLL